MKCWIRQTSIHNVFQQCYFKPIFVPLVLGHSVSFRTQESHFYLTRKQFTENAFTAETALFFFLSVSYSFTRAAWNLSFERGQRDRYSVSIPLKVVNRRPSLRIKLCSLYFLCIFHRREKYPVSPWPLLCPSSVCVSITCSVSYVSAHVLGSGHERLIDCTLKAWTL